MEENNLVGKSELKLVKNAKVLGKKEFISQHKLLVAVRKIQTPSERQYFIGAKQKLWRLCEPKVQFQHQNFIKERHPDVTQVAQKMYNLTDCLLSLLGRVCGKTRRG